MNKDIFKQNDQIPPRPIPVLWTVRVMQVSHENNDDVIDQDDPPSDSHMFDNVFNFHLTVEPFNQQMQERQNQNH